MSAALARLRDFFGDDIRVARGRRMHPTALVESLAPSVRGLLGGCRHLLLVDRGGGGYVVVGPLGYNVSGWYGSPLMVFDGRPIDPSNLPPRDARPPRHGADPHDGPDCSL
jgi:hypothetical protein